MTIRDIGLKRRWMVPLLIFGIFLFGGKVPVDVSAQEMGSGAAGADYIGSDSCLACHSAQENFKHSLHANKMAKVKGIAFDKSCETCHGPGSLHAEAAGDASHPGFAMIRTFKKMEAKAVDASCLACHQDSRRIHWQGGEHASRGVSCLDCHSVHDPKSAGGLLVKTSETNTCFQCHKDIKAEVHRNSHMPILEGKMTCADCHNPHGSAVDKMLAADNVNQLCYKCHAEKRGPFLWTHPPVQEDCMTCHAPHGSHHDKMLEAKMPMLCQRCHFNSGHNNQAYDAVQISGQQNRLANKSCVNCHSNIHGSNHPSGKFFTR